MRFSLTVILSFLFVAVYSQENIPKDSLTLHPNAIVVTLLGTGAPPPSMIRFGPSILVQAGTETLLFDAGRGCLQRLQQLAIPYSKINALFLTHLHSDHLVGLPDLWLTGWLVSERKVPLKVFGPSGSTDMVNNLRKAFAFDIHARESNNKAVDSGSKLLVKEMIQGIVYDKNGVKVIAFKVDHYPNIPAFGFRIEYKGHSVVLSGDTRYSKNLINFAKGTDLLIHEVCNTSGIVNATDSKYHIVAHHVTIEQAAAIFNEVKPRLAAYSHITNPYRRTEDDILKRTKAIYPGDTVLGEDLMNFTVEENITVHAWQKNR